VPASELDALDMGGFGTWTRVEEQLVLDFSITHPVLGARSANGTMRWNDKVLAQKAKDKWNKHGCNYNVIGYAFAPCVMTTYGQIHGHLLCLLYVLAKKQAETVHIHKQQFTHIEHLLGLFFAQSHARIRAAVTRGMALCAMGCSLMGVSKVFLLHVAPTRYGDQTFAAGKHLALGFSQWHLALAVFYLYICMYNVSILWVFPLWYFYHCINFVSIFLSFLFLLSNKI
jgi:hypothetical protein